MRKLLFFDVDGTLSWPGNPATPATIAALKKAQANGHLIFLCTGRGTCYVNPEILHIGFDGGIFQVGSLAYVGDTKVVDHVVDPEILREIIHRIEDIAMSYRLDCNDQLYQSRFYDVKELAEQYDLPEGIVTLISGAECAPLSEYKDYPVYKMICMSDGMKNAREIRRRLEGLATVTTYESFTGEDSLVHCDICINHDSKATAMYAICEYLGASPEDCVAFGDDLNDTEIMTAAGTSIAMGNANPKIKELATRVTEHCLEDGIAKELERMGLI